MGKHAKLFLRPQVFLLASSAIEIEMVWLEMVLRRPRRLLFLCNLSLSMPCASITRLAPSLLSSGLWWVVWRCALWQKMFEFDAKEHLYAWRRGLGRLWNCDKHSSRALWSVLIPFDLVAQVQLARLIQIEWLGLAQATEPCNVWANTLQLGFRVCMQDIWGDDVTERI